MAHGALALTPARTAKLAWRALLVKLLCALLGLAGAQPAPAAGAAGAYAAAERALAAALDSVAGRAPSPDDPAWHAALQAASRAAAVAATELEAAGEPARAGARAAAVRAYRLEAHAYGLANWYSRAFEAWDAFLGLGGEPAATGPDLPGVASGRLPSDRQELHRVVSQLAFARYAAGDFEGARTWYLTLLGLTPDDPESLRWLARMAYEEGDTADAVVIWQRLVEVAPDDEGARFFLELSKERERYGAAASDAYRAGLRDYDAGRLGEALAAFEMAVDANGAFVNAAVWAGRTALEAGRPQAAVRYWELAVKLDPSDARSAWFLANAQLQSRWGVEAGTAYYDGLAEYDAGLLEEAHASFRRAAEAAPSFKDAFVWVARTAQELGRPDEAIAYWQTVLRLDRTDERARYFIRNARQAIVYGTQANDAFTRGQAAYQAGDGAAAQAHFEEAAELAPTFEQAWAQLGKVAFQNRDFATAAVAYGHAAKLNPDDDDYAFFAAEAERLAGAQPTGR